MNPINIAEILKNYPEGTKFWSDSLGNIKLVGIDEKDMDNLPISVTDEGGKEFKFTKEGNFNKYSGSAFPSIMPSKYMNSWDKLLWKKGDILLNRIEERELLPLILLLRISLSSLELICMILRRIL